MEKMLGIINPDGYEKVNRVYSIYGDSPTLQSRDYKDPIKILSHNTNLRVKVVGRMDHILDHTYESANRVYSVDGICPTIPVCASDKTPKVLVRMRLNL